MQLAPLPVVVPLLVAAVLAGGGNYLPRRLLDLVACLGAGFVLAVCICLTCESRISPIVYWYGGWFPQSHFPIGISFVIDPIGAGLAALVAMLVLAAFIFSWRYFESVKSLYHAVMLAFLGAMCGLCLTGDLFNLFVWFELMSAAGVILCGYRAEEAGPLQGAINFAVTNTLGAYLSLTGVALLYAQTGALNFAQVGRGLIEHNPGGPFLAIAFLFTISGFLVKAAAFPFHFWLDDAHAVAPTPVCILFSGVMVELGLYAVARIYWSIFAVPLQGISYSVRSVFLTMGAVTALVGGIECFGQRHLKRLLAFSTISHMGLMILGFALLDSDALAGTAMYVIGHGMVKGSLFICAGVLLHRFGSVDEHELKGRGRKLPIIAPIMLVGALGLAGLPPFADFSGEALVDHAAKQQQLPWIAGVFMVAGMLTAGAVLRVWGRIFLGWGQKHEAVTQGAPRIPMEPETEERRRRTPVTMWAPALCLLLLAMCLGPIGSFRAAMKGHAGRMQDSTAYAALVLDGRVMPPPQSSPPGHYAESAWHQAIVLAGAVFLALAALFPRALGERFGRRGGRIIRAAMHPIRVLHSGKVGDYVAWFLLGLAAYGGFLLLHCGRKLW